MELLDALLQADEPEARRELGQLGLRDPARAYFNLRQILAAMNPPEFGAFFEPLAHALKINTDPDRALSNLERLNQAAAGPLRLTIIARERPFLFELIVDLLGFSQFISDVIIRYPHYVSWLGDPQTFEVPVSVDVLSRDLREAIGASETPLLRQKASIRWLRRALVRAGSRERIEIIRGQSNSSSIAEKKALAHEEAFMHELSNIAIAAIQIALDESWQKLTARFGKPIEEKNDDERRSREAQFCVVGMGKLGGGELNFSSDVDLIFIYSSEGQTSGRNSGGTDLQAEGRITNHDFFCRLGELVSQFLSAITDEGYMYRVDTRLRPDGSEGPLARSLAAFEIYHETQARSWERLALIKGAAIAGGADLCDAFDRMSRALVFDRMLGSEIIREIAELKTKIDNEVETGKEKGREIKRGHGGIREIEFLIQTLQLLHGAGDPALQSRSSLEALEALVSRGKIAPEWADQMRQDYLYLRRIEHRLQMMDLRQTHTLPNDPDELDTLARRCGIAQKKKQSPGEILLQKWNEISSRVHGQFIEFFGEASARANSGGGAEVSAAKAAELILTRAPDRELIPHLVPYGLESGESIASLKRMAGLGSAIYLDRRGQELYLKVAPRLIESASASARPVVALNHLESFLNSSAAVAGLLELFGADPALLALLLKGFGAADSWAKTLIAHPEYFEYLLDRQFLIRESTREAITRRLVNWSTQAGTQTAESLSAGLSRLRRFEGLMTGLAEIDGLITFKDATHQISLVAEVGIQEALKISMEAEGIRDQKGFSILGLGKLGTRELNHFSDLDILFCWEDETGALGLEPHATPIAERVVQMLTAATPEGLPYSVDSRLRPEGQNAPLAPPASRYREYYSARAEIWEMQSIMKARHVAGDPEVSSRLLASLSKLIASRVAELERNGEVRRSMREMRRRMEQSVKIPKWVLCDFKKGPGGTVDLEFLAQYFQLIHLAEDPSLLGASVDDVFENMRAKGGLDQADASSMCEDYRFLRNFESRVRLLFETDRSHAPAGGEQWDSLVRACASLVSRDEDLRDKLLLALRRNRERFDRIMR